ncbi:unnamed protein product [Strongylus vulgaris]|uniref:Uncharacterized protein n=1 Tax=Strongylus vulgaris TaxID=40348 RepID=A0A3P7IWQ4_STRVU|nr:unnamed protein product [Strongylus vulgaris]
MMLNPQVPTSSANVNAAQAANQMLQQAGLTISASGQIMQSKKWRRDERRQRELEQRLALALTTSHLTSDALANPLWKELLEAAQPKFTFNEDPQYFEQVSLIMSGQDRCLSLHFFSKPVAPSLLELRHNCFLSLIQF